MVWVVQAQVTVRDSLQIENGVPKREHLRVDPELQFSIPPDSLTYPGHILFDLQMEKSRLPLSMDFSEYIFQEYRNDSLNILLPTYLLKRYGLEVLPVEEQLGSFKIHGSDLQILRALYIQNGGTFRYSAEDILRMIFWKSERAKRRNRKYANAYKFYHGFP